MSPFILLLPASAQPLIDIDIENNNKGEEEVEDNNTKEPPPPPAVVWFISVWKVFNRKEVLPRICIVMLDWNILYLLLTC